MERIYALLIITMLFLTNLSTAMGQNAAISTPRDSAAIVVDGENILRLRLDEIMAAKNEILMGTFLIRQDSSGKMILAALRERARAGIKVRVYFDALHTFLTPAMLAQLQSEGIEVKLFNAFQWKNFFKIDSRDHGKVAVFDGKYVHVGDTNIGDEYFGRGDSHNMKSRDMLTFGQSALAAALYIRKMLENPEVAVPKIKLASDQAVIEQKTKIGQRQILINKILKFIGLAIDAPDVLAKPEISFYTQDEFDAAKLELDAAHAEHLELRARLQWGEPLQWIRESLQPIEGSKFLHDAISAKGKTPGMEQDILEMIDRSQKSLIIISPYLVIPAEEMRAIQAAIARGVKVQIYTNSVSSSDNKTVQAAYEMRAGEIAKKLSGVEIYEWMGEETWHAKMLIVDDKHLIVTGYNMDNRSKLINRETGHYLQSDVLVRRMREQLKTDSREFLLVAKEGRVLEVKSKVRTCESVFSTSGAVGTFMKTQMLKAAESRL